VVGTDESRTYSIIIVIILLLLLLLLSRVRLVLVHPLQPMPTRPSRKQYYYVVAFTSRLTTSDLRSDRLVGRRSAKIGFRGKNRMRSVFLLKKKNMFTWLDRVERDVVLVTLRVANGRPPTPAILRDRQVSADSDNEPARIMIIMFLCFKSKISYYILFLCKTKRKTQNRARPPVT